MLNLNSININNKAKKIIVISIFIHLMASIFSQGFYHSDEHFQILEFALLKTGVNQPADLAWEYDYKIRPAIQPAIAYTVIKLFGFISIKNPFIIVFFLRFLSAILNILSVYLIVLLFIKDIKYDNLKLWFIRLSFLLWPLIYIHVRFSSESWSGALFFIGMSLYLLRFKNITKNKFFSVIFFGMIMGFAFLLRFQVGIMLLSFIAWLFFVKKEMLKNIVIFLFGIFVAVGIGVVIDRWFYDAWTFTPWNYFNINIIKDISSQFGALPWWYYFKAILIKAFPPFSILIILALFFIILFKTKNILTWIIIPFFLIHLFISHKEIRFLFPLINILSILYIISLQEVFNSNRLIWLRNFISKYSWKWLINLFWVMNTVLLVIVMFRPSNSNFYMYYYLYNAPYKKIYYFGDKNPFLTNNKFKQNPIVFNFYKRTDLQVLPMRSIESIIKYQDINKAIVILAEERNFKFEKELKKNRLKYKILFRNIPKWVQSFNINSWVKRTKFVTIYKVYLK